MGLILRTEWKDVEECLLENALKRVFQFNAAEVFQQHFWSLFFNYTEIKRALPLMYSPL